jgi:hypothetical protein
MHCQKKVRGGRSGRCPADRRSTTTSPRCSNAPNRRAKPQPPSTKTPPGTPSGDRVTKPAWSRCSNHMRPSPIPNGCGAIIRVSRTTYKRETATGFWKASREVAYFLREFLLPSAICAQAIRHVGAIENRSHYVRDGKMPIAFAAIQASSHACDLLRPILCASTALKTSAMLVIA